MSLSVVIVKLAFSTFFSASGWITNSFLVVIVYAYLGRIKIRFESVSFFINEIRIKVLFRIIGFYSEFDSVSFRTWGKWFRKF